MTLELTKEDALLLVDYLGRQLTRLDEELIHTEKREFRHALAADIERLRNIYAQLSQVALAA